MYVLPTGKKYEAINMDVSFYHDMYMKKTYELLELYQFL